MPPDAITLKKVYTLIIFSRMALYHTHIIWQNMQKTHFFAKPFCFLSLGHSILVDNLILWRGEKGRQNENTKP